MVCLFFFKQKTAYEVRISDWSSDVCSSDLTGGSSWIESPDGDGLFVTGLLVLDGAEVLQVAQETDDEEIGRASCRERVCQTCRSRGSPYYSTKNNNKRTHEYVINIRHRSNRSKNTT